MRYLTTIVIMFVAQAAFAQQHTPRSLPSEGPMPAFLGEIVPFDAEIVHITPAPVYLIDGTRLDSAFNQFETQSDPIRLLLLYDVTYTVQMFGFPDDPANPLRAEASDSITLTTTDEQKIKHYRRQQGLSRAFFMTNTFPWATWKAALALPD